MTAPDKIWVEARALVERLLKPTAYSAPHFDIPHPIPIQKEAADALTTALDEIERLRWALEKIEQQADYGQVGACLRIAEEALKGTGQ